MKQGGVYDRSARMSMAATVSSLSGAAAALEWGRWDVWQGGGCVRLAMGCRGERDHRGRGSVWVESM